MKSISIILFLAILAVTSALPIFQARSGTGLSARENSTSAAFGNSASQDTTKAVAPVDLGKLNEDATTNTTQGTSNNGGSKKATTKANTPSAAQVKAAVSGFASDAKTVSAALNSLPTMTDKTAIASMAAKAFAAESDEDSQRAVLSAAAGSAGSASNAKIVKNTPVVLNGLKAIQKNPASVKTNVNTIETARNAQILPSITQLSNAALDAMGLAQTAQKFPATGQ
ncbi:ppe family protein [Rutstroemia sp. NJR-2017a BVV2]|nr:ppe family protein [Rutstroemia sp. NJR-2017a BVV2]